MNTEQIAKRLVELCRKGEYEQAQRELYAQDAGSIEMPGSPGASEAKGLEAICEKGRQWAAGVEAVHASNVSNPTVAGNWSAWPFPWT